VSSPLIIVSHGPQRRVVDRCRVCHCPFFEDESRSRIERHIIECVKANHDRLMADRKRQHPEIMAPWDPEYAKWIQDPAKLRGLMSGEIKP
jgi:hypothetical protein